MRKLAGQSVLDVRHARRKRKSILIITHVPIAQFLTPMQGLRGGGHYLLEWHSNH